MKTKVKNKNSFTNILSVEIPWSDLKADYEAEFNRIKANAKPPGGRKGKFFGDQLTWFIKNYTPTIEAEFAQNSINRYYKQAIDEMEIIPINQGQILDMKFKNGEDLKFDIQFEIKPDFKLPNYEKKFKVTATKYISSKQDLDDTLKDLQSRFSKMKEIDSPLSGEMSGHVCYADDFFGYDDAMYVALRLLRILGNQSENLSDLIGEYPTTYSTPETRFDVEEIRKFAIIDEIKERLLNIDGEVIDIDGIRVQNSLGWFLIRASNTQNQLTCRAEALSKENLLSLIKVIEDQLSLSGVTYKFTV